MKKYSYVKRLSTQFTRKELAQFRVVRKFVAGFCGKVSDAEVLRYLVREWRKEDHQ